MATSGFYSSNYLPGKRNKWAVVFGMLALLAVSFTGMAVQAQIIPSNNSTFHETAERVTTEDIGRQNLADFRHSDLTYIPNHGQFNDDVLYTAQGNNLTMWLTHDGVVYDFHQTSVDEISQKKVRNGHVVKMTFAGGHAVGSSPKEQWDGVYNYYIGSDRNEWIEGVPRFKEVSLEDLYPGISLRLYSEEGLPRYDIIAEPWADLASVSFDLEGAENMYLTQEGELAFNTSLGEIKHGDLFAYQVVDGDKVELAAGFDLKADGSVSFDVEVEYPNLAVVIDPLIYSTLISGSEGSSAIDIAVEDGNVYILGTTSSTDFPTTSGAYEQTYSSGDSNSFVSKFNDDGSDLVYSTFFGSSDVSTATAIDVEDGEVYITGYATDGLPTTAGAFQPEYGGEPNFDVSNLEPPSDGFLTKLSANGGSLEYSTYLGGLVIVQGRDVVVENGYAYVTGIVGLEESFFSTIPDEFTGIPEDEYFDIVDDFPVTDDAFQQTHGNIDNPSAFFGFGTIADAFVTKFSQDGSSLEYSTYMGGEGMDTASRIDVENGYAYVAGNTQDVLSGESVPFPVTSGVYNETLGGDSGMFITRLNLNASALDYSTHISANGGDSAYGIAVENGDAYVVGSTAGGGFPTTSGAFLETKGSGRKLFVLSLADNGSSLNYSTFVGSLATDLIGTLDGVAQPADIAVENGYAVITGTTVDENFPTTGNAFQDSFDEGTVALAFLTRLAPDGSDLSYSTLFGGLASLGVAVAAEESNLYVAGATEGPGFPTTPGAYDETTIWDPENDAAQIEAFVAKFNTLPIVTNTNNEGSGSLRGVAGSTLDGETVIFDESLSGETITLTSGQIFIDKSITIDASNLPEGVTISGNNNSRIFEIEADREVTLRSLSITNGSDVSAGGIRNTGDLTLENVTIYDNSATGLYGSGGGILNNGTTTKLTLRNSTISGNSTASGDTYGGGIYAEGNVILENSTLFNNSAAASGGGIFKSGGSLVLRNSVIAGSGEGDCVASGGLTVEYSFIEDGSCGATLSGDPKLGELSDNGGPTLTHLPQSGSPLLDAGSCNSLSTDQRGENRPVDLDFITDANDGCDIGSVEARTDEVSPLASPDENNILYVDQNVSGGLETGSSWSNAIPELRKALAWAQDWDADEEGSELQIWVADGLYLPTDDATDRFATFQLVNDVEIYGGFAGGESNLSDRDWNENLTILSGDIADDDTADIITDPVNQVEGGNSHHLVTGSGTGNTAILDGFTITAGRSAGGGDDENGSGICNLQGSPALANLIISGNWARGYGGGMVNEGQSDPIITNVEFIGNVAGVSGGGMLNEGQSVPLLTNVIFIENKALNGGGIYNDASSPTLVNVSFSGNEAENFGGGMASFGDISEPELRNVIMWDNEADGSNSTVVATIYNVSDADPQISNSLIANSGGSDSWNSDIGTNGGNNIDVDPLFTDPGNGDYTLQNNSPAINAGTNTPYESGGDAEGITTDLAGNDRIYNSGTVDMGAYEFQGEPFSIGPDGDNILYVDQGAEGKGSGNSWANAIPELRDALAWAQNWDGETDGTLQIWVAAGIYLPTDDETDRFATFQLVNDVEIYGGFDPDGGADEFGERDWNENLTILSGDIDDNDDEEIITDPENQITGGNSHHVVNSSGTDDTAVLDGFTITAGLANGTNSATNSGAGLLNDDGTPVLTHLAITGNNARNGGGMYIWGSSPTLSNVLFTANHAEDSGGGIDVINSAPVLTAVIVSGNSASYGGGMSNLYSDPVITGGLFESNSASYGGGMYNEFSSSILTNLTLTGNTAGNDGGGMYNYREPIGEETSNLTNVIIWGNKADESSSSLSASIYNISQYANPQISHSLIANSGGSNNWANEIGTDGGNNIEADPLFTDPSNGDFTLQNTSLAINAGDNDAVPDGVTTDLAGNPRFFDGGTVDMGAYEFQGEPVTIPEAVVLSTPSDEAANVGLTPEFGWKPLDGADTYNLQVSENEEFSSTVIDESGLTETTFEPASDLGYSTTYYWRARASNAAGDGEWSEIFSFTTLPESSEVVILTDPSDEAGGVPLQPLFEWNTADGADSYDLVVSVNSDFSDPVIEAEEMEDTEYQTEVDLDFSTTYYWQVRGVNTGGDGEWSETFKFTTLDQPEAADNRILLANTDNYTFTPADFGTNDNSFTVVIDDLPGVFNGQLQLEDSDVNTGNELLVGDIDDGKLMYTPQAEEYGYGYDSFNFSIKDAGGNPSEASYTMSLDIAATSVELTGNEGWRFLGNPSDGDSYDDLLDPIWTKGMAGSDSPGATFSNVNVINQTEYQWDIPGDLANPTEPGQPFLVYVYSDDDNDGTQEGFPKTLTSGENWLPLSGEFSFDELSYGESPSNTDNFYLVANPHPVSLDFCEFVGTNIATATTFWNPNANGGNGDYQALNCATIEELPIAPFQAFWIRTTDTNPALDIPTEAYLETSTEEYFKEPQVKEDLFRIILNVESEDQRKPFSNRTELYFSEDASADLDEMDAVKLSPQGLANRWLSLYSMDEDNKPYAFQSVPMDFDEKVSIPLDIQTTESGRFDLSWNLPKSHIFNGSYYLRDNETGEVIELRGGSNYSFEITPEQAVQMKQAGATDPMSELAENTAMVLDTHRMSSVGEPRFELLIAATGVDGFTELGAVPEAFELAQNYPNPFNPTTVISYQLPVSSEVRLEVYDMLGRNVATLVNDQVSAGRHTVNFDATGLSSGIYLYRLQAGSQIMARKLTVVK